MSNRIERFAGSTAGSTYQEIYRLNATFGNIDGITIYNDDMYVCPNSLGVIIKIRISDGYCERWAGTGVKGHMNGAYRTSCEIGNVHSIAFTSNGDGYFNDTLNNYICRVDANTGIIYDYIGNGTTNQPVEGADGYNNPIPQPYSICTDINDNILIPCYDKYAVYRVDSNRIVTRIAGTYNSAGSDGDGGAATSAKLGLLYGVCARYDAVLNGSTYGGFYIADNGNTKIRYVNTSGVISTLSSDMGKAYNICVDLDNVAYSASGTSYKAFKCAVGGSASTIAGTGSNNNTGDGGEPTVANILRNRGICRDSNGNIYIATDSIIRKIIYNYPRTQQFFKIL